jgi:hypothetical protein
MADFQSALKVRQDDPTQLQAQIKGFGTAGVADANPVTVQGIAGMTPVLVSNVDADVTGVPLGTAASITKGSAAAVAANAVAAALVTVPVAATRTLYVRAIIGSGSGRAKYELWQGADIATGTAAAVPLWTTAAQPSGEQIYPTPIAIVGGVNINAMIKATNEDLLAQDLSGCLFGYLL